MFRNFASTAFVVGTLSMALVPSAGFARGGGGGHAGGGGHGSFSGSSARSFSGSSRGYSQAYSSRGFAAGGAYAGPRGYSGRSGYIYGRPGYRRYYGGGLYLGFGAYGSYPYYGYPYYGGYAYDPGYAYGPDYGYDPGNGYDPGYSQAPPPPPPPCASRDQYGNCYSSQQLYPYPSQPSFQQPPQQVQGLQPQTNGPEPGTEPLAAGGVIGSPQNYYLIAYKNHAIYSALAYWVEDKTLHYVTTQNTHNQASLDLVDLTLTKNLNRANDVPFSIPGQ
jgi:hypothetical protein